MQWSDVLWIFIASACLTIAFTHARALVHRGNVRSSAALTLIAVSVALIAIEELRIHRAQSVEAFASLAWSIQFPIATAVIGIVWFLDGYVTGRARAVGWVAAGLRIAGLAIHVLSPTGVMYRDIPAINRMEWLGAKFTVPVVEANPLVSVNQSALLVLLVYLAIATVQFWRKGDRRRALNLGAPLFVLIGGGATTAVLALWGLVKMPIVMAPFFLPIIIGMSRELGFELVKAGDMQRELQLKEAQLRESEIRMLLAADAAEAGLWSIDLDEGRLWATPRAMRMFALDPQLDHGLAGVLSAIHPEDRPRVQEALSAMQGTDGVTIFDFRVTLSDGQTRWYMARGGIHLDVSTNHRCMMGTTTDITEVRLLQMELEMQRAEIAHLARVSTLSEMSGSIAHELNQPLTAILSNAQAGLRFIEGQHPQYGEIAEILRDIVENNRRATEIIMGLRRMLKKGDVHKESIDIRELVMSVVALTRSDCINRMVKVDVIGAEFSAQVMGDRVQLQQVLINLITNALEAMASVDAARRRLRIEVGISGDRRVEVRVADDGPGFRPGESVRAFSAFYTTKASGLGLGLAICQQIVRAHGGDLSAENRPSGGALLRLSLPAVVKTRASVSERALA